jgi:carbamate kinase
VRIVVALGGNAIAQHGESLDPADQVGRVQGATRAVAELAHEHAVVVTHGNGPQVGMLAAADEGLPLDVAGAESEGMIGYWIDQELGNLLPNRDIAALLTQVEVDPSDPAFARPTKPIGRVYDRSEAEGLMARRHWQMAPANGGLRRVVASPEPIRIIEERTISLLVRIGVIVVCGGGGGIPVARDAHGRLHGVEAVIDKDLSAARLAADLDADLLLLLTDVPGVYADWPMRERLIRAVPPRLLRDFDFETGTMAPKVEAARRFARRPGASAAIGALEDAARIVRGEAGTRIDAGARKLEIDEGT